MGMHLPPSGNGGGSSAPDRLARRAARQQARAAGPAKPAKTTPTTPQGRPGKHSAQPVVFADGGTTSPADGSRGIRNWKK